nr:rep protein [Cressdnaviricota sp.]UOF81647.1 rep protein [Cressdnaviricota sp.]
MQVLFSQAKTIRKKALKDARIAYDLATDTGHTNPQEIYDITYKKTIEFEEKEFRHYLEISKRLSDIYTDVASNTSIYNWYFITIRPDETKCTFSDFFKLVNSYVEKKMITEYTLSFEQKGTSIDTLGKGFHCHIVADSTCRSKGELLRRSQAHFKDVCSSNNIDIRTTKNPDDIINNYLIEYKSEDGHKETTKEMDTLWRSNNSLKSIYNTEDAVNKPVTASKTLDTSSVTSEEKKILITW